MTCKNQFVKPCDACIELANLDATPITSQNFLDLIHKRHRNKSNLNLWHDSLVSRLPNEIMSLIFISLAEIDVPEGIEPGGVSFWDQHWDHLLFTPLLLSRVCRKWRNIALATPQLWTKLIVDPWTQSLQLDLLAEILSRSCSLPLSLALVGRHTELDFPSELEPVMILLRSHSARWKSLNTDCVSDGMTEKLLHNLDEMPTSDLLHLSMRFFDPEPIVLRTPLRPRHFCYHERGYEISKVPLRILQWDNLTSLNIWDISINALCHLIQQTHQLTTCTVNNLSIYAEASLPPLPQAPITILSLRHLHVTSIDDDSLVFRYLTLPGLTRLTCSFENEIFEAIQDLPLQDIINFIARSRLDSKPLRMFDLQYNLNSMNYDLRFTELTTLTHLSIFIHDVENQQVDVFEAYLSRMSDISILPNLRRFYIWIPKIPSLSWKFLCNVFQAWGISPSKSGFTTNDGSIHAASDSIISTLPDPSLPQRFHKRPLKEVTVEVNADEYTPMIPYQEYLLLQDIQKSGVIELNLQDSAEASLLEMMAKIYKPTSDS